METKWGELGIKNTSIRYFYQISSELKKILYYPTWVGHYNVTTPYQVNREKYDDYMLTYVKKGNYFLVIIF